MQANPLQQHRWLTKLVGSWTYQQTCSMGPEQPEWTGSGTELVRSVGDLWIVLEGRGDMPDGAAMATRMTLGFDPLKDRFVGSFVASMMTYQWLYEGTLDDAGRILSLQSTGPSHKDDGTMANYIDAVTIVSDDHRIFSSRTQGDDGTWKDFMVSHYHRVA